METGPAKLIKGFSKHLAPKKYEYTKEVKKLKDHFMLELKTLEALHRARVCALR